MTIYVTGSSGYIGSNLMKHYPECVPVKREGLPHTEAGDVIINLSAYGLHAHQTEPVTMTMCNALYPIRLYNTMSNGARLIHCCSYSERNTQTIRSETHLQYCRTKSIATAYLRGKACLAWIHTPFGGINQPPHKFMTALIQTARDGGEFHCVHANATRDLIHVRHMATGLMKLATEDVTTMEADLGSGDLQVQAHVANMVRVMAHPKLTVTVSDQIDGDVLLQSRNPYIKCDFMEDLKKEVLG